MLDKDSFLKSVSILAESKFGQLLDVTLHPVIIGSRDWLRIVFSPEFHFEIKSWETRPLFIEKRSAMMCQTEARFCESPGIATIERVKNRDWLLRISVQFGEMVCEMHLAADDFQRQANPVAGPRKTKIRILPFKK